VVAEGGKLSIAGNGECPGDHAIEKPFRCRSVALGAEHSGEPLQLSVAKVGSTDSAEATCPGDRIGENVLKASLDPQDSGRTAQEQPLLDSPLSARASGDAQAHAASYEKDGITHHMHIHRVWIQQPERRIAEYAIG